jgi:hypothetical protein
MSTGTASAWLSCRPATSAIATSSFAANDEVDGGADVMEMGEAQCVRNKVQDARA